MPTDDEMTIHEERKYLRRMQKRYVKSDREEQGRLLDAMVAFTGKHRKSLIRLMNGDLARKKRRKQRGKTYGPGTGATPLMGGYVAPLCVALQNTGREELRMLLTLTCTSCTAPLLEQRGKRSVEFLWRPLWHVEHLGDHLVISRDHVVQIPRDQHAARKAICTLWETRNPMTAGFAWQSNVNYRNASSAGQ